MEEYKAIEDLEEFVATAQVLDEGKDYSDEIEEAQQLLSKVRKECGLYVKDLMGDLGYVMVLNLPVKRLEISSQSDGDLDLVCFPFGMFSINLWKKLQLDDKNPIFRVIRYFELNARYLETVLGELIENNQLMTDRMMTENQMIDLYSMHSYYYLYKDASDYLKCNTNIRGYARSWSVRIADGGVPVVTFIDDIGHKPERIIKPLDVRINNRGIILTIKTCIGAKAEYVCPFSRLNHEVSMKTIRQKSESVGFKPIEPNILYFVHDLLVGLLGEEFDLDGLLSEYATIKNDLRGLDFGKITKNIMG